MLFKIYIKRIKLALNRILYYRFLYISKIKLILLIKTKINELKNENLISSIWDKCARIFELPRELREDDETKYFTAPYNSLLHKKFLFINK